MTDLKQLNEERERLLHDFTSGIAEWLEELNKYVDRIVENSEKTERELREVVDNMLIGGSHEPN